MIWWENTLRNLLWDSYENNEIRVFSLLWQRWEHAKSWTNPNISLFWIAPLVLKTIFYSYPTISIPNPKSANLSFFRAASVNLWHFSISWYFFLCYVNPKFRWIFITRSLVLFLISGNRFCEKVESRSWYRCEQFYISRETQRRMMDHYPDFTFRKNEKCKLSMLTRRESPKNHEK